MQQQWTRRRSWSLLAAILLAAGAGLAGAMFALSYSNPPQQSYLLVAPFERGPTLQTFTEHGVRVTLTLEQDHAGVAIVTGLFEPVEPGFHLYSKDLPRAGINGAGRPTLLEMPPQENIHPIGVLSASQPVVLREQEGFSTPFPLYPDGAVTLRLPITRAGSQSAPAQIALTYMACSSRGLCLPPVEQKLVNILLP